MNLQKIQNIIPNVPPWMLFPDSYACKISNGLWKREPWLVYLSQIIFKAVLQGDARIIINAPPRFGKSLFLSRYVPSWFLNFNELFHLYPGGGRVILTSYQTKYAYDWASKAVHDIYNNQDKLAIKFIRDTMTGRLILANEAELYAAGARGAITGKGGHLLLIDDLIKNYDEAKSPTMQQKNIDWFRSTFYTRMEPGASIIVLCTRWHDLDIVNWLLTEQGDDWQHIVLRAVAEDDDILGRKPGESLSPRHSTERIMKMRAGMSHLMFDCQYQQRPRLLSGNIFKKEWLTTRYLARPRNDDVFCRIISVDSASEIGEKNSYSVFQVWEGTKDGYYLVDVWRDQWEYPTLKKKAYEIYEKYKADIMLIEVKSSGAALFQDLRKEKRIPVGPVNPKKDSKEVRAHRQSAVWEGGLVYLPERADWLEDFIYELITFPNGTNNDQVDSMTQALWYLRWKKDLVDARGEDIERPSSQTTQAYYDSIAKMEKEKKEADEARIVMEDSQQDKNSYVVNGVARPKAHVIDAVNRQKSVTVNGLY